VKRTSIFSSILVVALVSLAGCDSDSGKKGASSAAPTTSSTVKTEDVKSADVESASDACDKYVKALEECIAKQPDEAKAAFQAQLDAHNKAFKEAGAAAKTQMEQGCVTGLATLKQACK
jgi:hypothetical protein